LIKSALRILYDIWPESLSFESLAAKLRSDLTPQEVNATELAEVMLQCYVGQFVELHRFVPRFAVEVSARPAASPLARLQAGVGGHLTNLRHMSVNVYDLDRMILSLLDGTRDLTGLVAAVEKAMADGELQLQHDGRAAPEKVNVREILEREVPVILERLAKNALLVA
jgi:methyltransferase-like protein